MGDPNAKVGKEGIYKHITGGESKHQESNDISKILIEFAEGNGLKIMSTHFRRKDIYKVSWVSPDGRYKNQIDHVLVAEKYKSLIKNVKSRRDASVDSDQYLVQVD